MGGVSTVLNAHVAICGRFLTYPNLASMQPTVDDLLDLLLDGDPVAWQIIRTPDGLQIVGLMKNGETRVLANVPITIEDGQ